MTRRSLLFGVVAPFLAPNRTSAQSESDGFIVSGVLQEAGDLGYFALQGESVAFMLDPDKTPAMLKRADALVGKEVVLSLRRA